MAKKNKPRSESFKFKVALEALKDTIPVAQLCQKFEIAASQIYAWKNHLKDVGPEIFKIKNKADTKDAEIERLLNIIGKLKVENDFLERAQDR
jgi:transposase-like protein